MKRVCVLCAKVGEKRTCASPVTLPKNLLLS
jgi:hypothetical protein